MLDLTWGGWIYVGVSVGFFVLAFYHLYILSEIADLLYSILRKL